MMPAYQYVARSRLKVGDGYREYGELVPEADTWPNVDAYVNSGRLERIPIPNERERATATQHGQLRRQSSRPLVPDDYDQRVPTPVRDADRHRSGDGEGQQEVRCGNWSCRELNWLPDELPDTAAWQCWFCHQPQTLVEANRRSAPTDMAEYMHIRMRQEEARQ